MSSTSVLLLNQVQPVLYHAWVQKLDSELDSSVVIRAICSTVMRHLTVMAIATEARYEMKKWLVGKLQLPTILHRAHWQHHGSLVGVFTALAPPTCDPYS